MKETKKPETKKVRGDSKVAIHRMLLLAMQNEWIKRIIDQNASK